MKILILIMLITGLMSCSLVNVLNDMSTAHIYINKETGDVIYCENKNKGNPKNFRYAGTANVNPLEIRQCFLAN